MKSKAYGCIIGIMTRYGQGGYFIEEITPTFTTSHGDNAMSVCIEFDEDKDEVNDKKDIICYGMSSYDSNAMKSSNPHSGFYIADTSRTLDVCGGNPACNQGGILICQAKEKHI